MKTTYTLTAELTPLLAELGAYLKKEHPSALYLDQTTFVGKTGCVRINTYQILNVWWRGYITVNVYAFRPDMVKDELQVKVSLFSSYWVSSTRLMKAIQKEIHSFFLSHGAIPSEGEP